MPHGCATCSNRREKALALIFIDELDSLGRARGAPGIGGHDEKEQTINQLLAEMDGFDPSSALVLLAAINRPEVLDAALLRVGGDSRTGAYRPALAAHLLRVVIVHPG